MSRMRHVKLFKKKEQGGLNKLSDDLHLRHFKGFEYLWFARVLLISATIMGAYGVITNANINFVILTLLIGSAGLVSWIFYSIQYAIKKLKEMNVQSVEPKQTGDVTK